MSVRILITDDDKSIHDVFQMGLERALKNGSGQASGLLSKINGSSPSVTEGHVIDHAFSGEEAIEMVNKSISENTPYDVILMDIMMPPGIDGLETIQRIGQVHKGQQFIICTAFHTKDISEFKEACVNTRRSFLLAKPFNLNFFIDFIQNLVFADELTKQEFKELEIQ
jgi:CheY-like chemotaxis protein